MSAERKVNALMKKMLSLILAAAMLMSLVPASFAEAVTYIASPYAIDEALQGPTEYLDPIFYENENGPRIGVTYVGVIVEDGKYFKDSDNDKELDVFEDWRLDTQTRAADLVSKLTVEQSLGLLANQLSTNPTAKTAAQAKDENGKVLLEKLMTVTPDALHMQVEVEEVDNTAGFANAAKSLGSGERPNSTGEMLTLESRSGVLRMNPDAELGALWNNATNMVAEYAAVAKNEPTVPFMSISNPINAIGIPGSLGMAAAVMGDGAAEGDFSLIERYANLDRQLWDAKGIDGCYGPQIDLVTDPRWQRNSGTYGEVVDVVSGIAVALVKGYHDGEDDGVSLTLKHFPGDGAAYNGFESHNYIGEWRVYPTEGSLEKYQLPAFQAAIDAGLTGIMPGYSRPTDKAPMSVTQSYRGVVLTAEEIANGYNTTVLTTLLRDTMGFEGYINTDSGLVTSQFFGAEDMTVPERLAAIINAGSDVIGDGFTGFDYPSLYDAYEQGLINPEAMVRANTKRVATAFDMGKFENPYENVAESIAQVASLEDEVAAMGVELNQKSVVLMKNHDNVLPLKDTTKRVFIEHFSNNGSDDGVIESWAAEFEALGFTVVDDEDECDIALLIVAPGGNGNKNFMNVVDLVEDLEVDAYNFPYTAQKTGEKVDVTTLEDVDEIAEIAETVHANGGKVIATINITYPWLLTNLEPHVDGLFGIFSTKVSAVVDVISGEVNPTGKLPVTLPACNEVIAVYESVVDGVVYDICVSPNDVPGYDKDQYMSDEVLAQSPSGSYAYMDADGNLYKAWHGLSY